MPEQLPLQFRWPSNITLDDFIIFDNEIVIKALKHLITTDNESQIFISGMALSGKSHLLMASCHQAEQQGISAAYLPMQEIIEQPVEILEGLECLDLIAIDDIHLCNEHSHWQVALFNLFNKAQSNRVKMIFSANSGPASLAIELADLRSRLCWGESYQVSTLNDDQKMIFLQTKMEKRGLSLTDEVSNYLLSHYSRNLNELIDSIELLDKASMAEKRKLSIPFVKMVLKIT